MPNVTKLELELCAFKQRKNYE